MPPKPPTAEEILAAYLVPPDRRTPEQWAVLVLAGVVELPEEGPPEGA